MRAAPYRVLALVLCAFASTHVFAAPARAQPVLAVMKFQDETGVMPLQGGIGRVVTNMLTNELAARDAFTVVERRKLLAILEEQDLAASGRLRPGEGARIGQLTGADYLVMGTITAFERDTPERAHRLAGRDSAGEGVRGAYLALDLRVVDATSGEVRYARTIEGRAASAESLRRARKEQLDGFESPIDAKAVRGAVLEVIDYLECEMVRRDGCRATYAAREAGRVEGTRRAFRRDDARD
ncbi:MAG: penicillin-binding protein activator LpoB [Xanthomonadales bacterium]|nr:penicillin-binding protein activator LpoB [Xanthomonadales bacterium]